MTDDPNAEGVDDEPAFARLYPWRWVALTLVFVGVGVVGALLATGHVGLVVAGARTLAFVAVGVVVSVVLALPIALVHTLRELDDRDVRLLVVFNVLKFPSVEFAVYAFDKEDWSDLDVVWGELKDMKGTIVPTKLAQQYDEDRHAAIGTWWSVESMVNLVRYRGRIREHYDDLEERAAKAEALEQYVHILAREIGQESTLEVLKALKKETVPGTVSPGDLLDDELADKHWPDQPDGDGSEVEEYDRDEDLPDPEAELQSAPESVATDGGQSDE